MVTPPRYRAVTMGQFKVNVQHQSDGSLLVSTPTPLADVPVRLTDKLKHWAARTPDRTFIARRDASGQWQKISYAQALEAARHIGQGLLNRGLDAEHPVVILSGNDLGHALLALGAQYAGIPYAPISPAYSLVSQDYAKLGHVIDLLTPGLVYASDATLYGNAVQAVVPGSTEFAAEHGVLAGRDTTSLNALLGTPLTPEIDAAQAATWPDTIAKFLFTSGSTSMPKAVITTQRMMCSNLAMIGQAWPFLTEEAPVFLDWLPWNHVFGGNHNVGLILYFGGSLYIDDGKPTDDGIETTLNNLREIAPTVYFNVPIGWEKIANALESDEDLRNNH